MSSSPQFIGVDTVAVKEATKNNYKSRTSSSFDDKLYETSSSMSYYFGPAVSSAMQTAKGSDSQSGMVVDAAINAAASGETGLSTNLGSGLAAYSTGGGYSGLSTGLGSSQGYTYDPYATSSGSTGNLDYTDFMTQMQSSNTEFLVMQKSVQDESSRFTMCSSILKSKHDSEMTAARNAA